MRIEDVEQPGNPVDLPGQREDSPDEGGEQDEFEVPSVAEYRATVDAVYRDYAIEQGCARVREIEENTVSPAMRSIESADPDRHLVGFENRLKGEDRLTEKVTEGMEERGWSAAEAFRMVKDAIRYTFQYSEEGYAEGVRADCDRLQDRGFDPIDRRNTWDNEEYKGINTRWRDSGSGQIFEVQFHTEASFKAKQETHAAYERLRSHAEDDNEVRQLRSFQREVTARIAVPPSATDIPSYRRET